MFKKALIAEDHESINISVRKTLDELQISEKEFRYYCDDALSLLNIAQRNGEPFDLMITDLSFEEDHHEQKIKGGKELIIEARKLQPGLKIVVFSLENNIEVVDSLFDDLAIDAYVRKARYDAIDLKKAIESVYVNRKYRSADLRRSAGIEHSHDFKIVDLEIIRLLCKGIPQKNIPGFLQENKIKPSGLSSVEKRLNIIKTSLHISSNEQLIAYCKDKKII